MNLIKCKTSWIVMNYSAREFACGRIHDTLNHSAFEFKQLTREVRNIVPSFEHEIENGIKDILNA